MTNTIEYEKSSGNVFEDLGLENSEDLQARSMVGFHVVEILNSKDMKQKEIAEILNIKQAEVSHLLNGHFSRFTIDKLLCFLKFLDQKITIEISPHKRGEPYHHVGFSA